MQENDDIITFYLDFDREGFEALDIDAESFQKGLNEAEVIICEGGLMITGDKLVEAIGQVEFSEQ